MTLRDERGIIIGFLVRMLLLFVLLGLMVFEAGAVIVAKVAVDGIALDAAREAALTYDRSDGSRRLARRECERLAERAGAECTDLAIRSGVASATVRKEASTLITHRIGALRRFTEATAQHHAPIP